MSDLALCEHCGEKVENPCESWPQAMKCSRAVGVVRANPVPKPDEPDFDNFLDDKRLF